MNKLIYSGIISTEARRCQTWKSKPRLSHHVHEMMKSHILNGYLYDIKSDRYKILNHTCKMTATTYKIKNRTKFRYEQRECVCGGLILIEVALHNTCPFCTPPDNWIPKFLIIRTAHKFQNMSALHGPNNLWKCIYTVHALVHMYVFKMMSWFKKFET